MNSDLTVLVKRRKCVCFVGVGKVNVRERVKNIGRTGEKRTVVEKE